MMKSWSFLNNPFLTATEHSFQAALSISAFHSNALSSMQSDSFFVTLYNEYQPIHLAFNEAYKTCDLQGDIKTGHTLSLKQMFALLSDTKINQWDIAIQVKFNKRSATYLTLMPDHRIPFQTGKQIDRIAALKKLRTALENFPELGDVRNDVDTFCSQLENINSTQKSGKTIVNTHSELLETARIKMCNAQYKNLGLLISHFNETPDSIAAYFDLQIIRKSSQVHFAGHVKPQQIHTIAQHTFGADDSVKFENKGTTDLHFYFSSAKDALPSTDGIKLKADEQCNKQVVEIGLLSNTFLMVQNTHASEKGAFEVEFI